MNEVNDSGCRMGKAYSAATEDRTGEVKEIKTRNEPEKTTEIEPDFSSGLDDGLTGIRQCRDDQHPSSLAVGKLKDLDPREMQYGQRDPQNR